LNIGNVKKDWERRGGSGDRLGGKERRDQRRIEEEDWEGRRRREEYSIRYK